MLMNASRGNFTNVGCNELNLNRKHTYKHFTQGINPTAHSPEILTRIICRGL